MKKPQHNCQVESCPNHGKYSRNCGHVEDVETVTETRQQKYLKAKKEFLKENPKCEVPGCVKDSKDVHHRAGRTGDYLFNPAFFMAVCRGCHLWIEAHPVKSKELGYSVSRHSKKEA